MDRLALYYHEDSLAHDTGGHPERVARVRAIAHVLAEEELATREPEAASVEQIGRNHPADYVAEIARISAQGGGALDVDTVLSSGSYRAATRAAGGAIAAAAAVLSDDAARAFSIARPPGHHARPDAGMGFCLFNNVAIAARAAQTEHGVGRVAIVDLDVHHGNGTQESFWEDPSVLFVSTHQYPFYPGSGGINEIGGGAGRGTTLNLPMPAGCGDAEYLAAVERAVVPKLEWFKPELVLLSLGFDAHWADPLAMMQVTTAGYVAMVERVQRAADALCDGRIAVVLEGGYNLEALAYGSLAVIRFLRGEPWSDPIGPAPTRQPVGNVDRILQAAGALHGL